MKIPAAVLSDMTHQPPFAASQPLEVTDVELAPPGPGELLVEVKAAGLCHSDLSVINGSRPRPLPMVLGHEAAGEVLEIGDGVHTAVPGDHVVLSFVPSCGLCRQCVAGRPVLCEPAAKANGAGTLLSGQRKLSRDGGSINHHLGVSGFATHTVVAQESVVRVPTDLPFDEAALFGCALLTGVGAVVNTADVRPGETVAVFGIGGIGLAMIMGARAAGASRIVAVDRSPDKLADARGAGATDTVRFESGAAEHVQDLTDGGVDVALEAAGITDVLAEAYQATSSGGRTVTAGLPDPNDRLPLSPVQLVGQGRTLKGSYMGSVWPRRDIPRFIAMYQAGLLPIKDLLSGYLTLDEVNAGFDHLADGSTLRQILLP
jgi:alcohol dehydrogenase